MPKHILWVVIAIIWLALLLSYTAITVVVSTGFCLLYKEGVACKSINALRLNP